MTQKPSSRRWSSGTKFVLRLPHLEHTKAAMFNSADAKRLLGTALGLQQDRGLALSLSSRIPSARPRTNQSASWLGALARLRGV
jgi:hypothetical protein